MTFFKNKIFLLLIITALSVKLFLAFLPGFKIDVDAWFAWAQRLNQVGFSGFYSDQIWTNYTPGFLYILGFLGFIKNLFQINDPSFYLILKIPSIIAELLLGIIVYQLVAKKSSLWATVAAIVILFNPAFIFNSSVWGQIDGLLSLMLILSIFLLNRKKLILSSIFFGLGFLIKPQAVALSPVFILFLIKDLSIKNFFKLTIPALLIVFPLSLPFFLNRPFSGVLELFSKMVSDYPYTSLFAYNFWGIVGSWVPDNTLWNGLSYQTWGYILLAIYWIIIGYFYFKKKLSFFALVTFATMGFFFLPTRVHERYLYPAIVFLILSSTIYKSRLLIALTGILSLIHFLNLYYVYVYYNEIYLILPRVLYNPIIYKFLDTNSKNLSLISTFIFILITIVIIRYDVKSSED